MGPAYALNLLAQAEIDVKANGALNQSQKAARLQAIAQSRKGWSK